MKTIEERLKVIEGHVKEDKIKVMIIGLGSVIFESVRSMRRNKQAHDHQGGE